METEHQPTETVGTPSTNQNEGHNENFPATSPAIMVDIGAQKPKPRNVRKHRDPPQQQQHQQLPTQNPQDNAASAVQLILTELRTVRNEVQSLQGKHKALDQKINQSLPSRAPPAHSRQDSRKRTSHSKHDQQLPRKRNKHSNNHGSNTQTTHFASQADTNNFGTSPPLTAGHTTNTNDIDINVNPQHHPQPRVHFQPTVP